MYKEYFKDKKIAIVGLGPHMEMVIDIKFLMRLGASVVVYDMRSESTVRHGLAELIDAGLTRYSFGQMNEPIVTDDLAATDLIILAPDVPNNASFLEKAYAAKVPVEFPQTLFLKLAPPITLIGVLGSCGKTTVSHMVYGILKSAFIDVKTQGIYYLDPDVPSALVFLKKAKKGDIVVARIPESLVPAYNEARISPHVAIFTVVPLVCGPIFHILEYQTYNNFIIGNDVIIDSIKENADLKSKAKMLRTSGSIVSSDWKIAYRGSYDRDNAALALRAVELFKVTPDTSREVLEGWGGLKGHLELVKKVANVEFYNDTASTSPTATLAALRSISENKNVVLMLGGAATTESYDELLDNVGQYVSTIVLLPGSGTMKIRKSLMLIKDVVCVYAHTIEEGVRLARDNSRKGDKVLFSPGFEAYGVEKSRKERGEKFVRAVRSL